MAKNHSFTADYFALGVFAYELMYGDRPYIGKNIHEIKEKILSIQVKISKKFIPRGWSVEAADFISRVSFYF